MGDLVIGDAPLGPLTVAAAARHRNGKVALSEAARARIQAACETVEELERRRPIYGRTTGVGSNRNIAAEPGPEHAMRLLSSHALGAGEELPGEVVRATLLVRLAQLAAGGSGLRPAVAEALVGAFNRGAVAGIRDLGQMGTGDLAVLAQIGMALVEAGEMTIERGDAMPIMSSNAATLGVAALALADARTLLNAGLVVAALTFRAVDGNAEAYAPAIERLRPLPGLAAVAGRMRALVAGGGRAARIQDPFGLRALPSVGGSLHAALDALGQVLEVEINAAAENPLIAEGDAFHHAGFHAAHLALALDAARLALVPFAGLSGARLATLVEPQLTGLTPFLAADIPGSSGIMETEYVAADALARLRTAATPTVTGGVVISRGVEEHASFAWQGADLLRAAAPRLRTVLAVEWVGAERALRMKGVGVDGPLREARRLAEAFDPRLEDRPLGADVAAAERQLDDLAAVG